MKKCEEGGAHLRTSFWQLLKNSKNNYLLQKLLKWANKILIFTMLNFFWKIKKHLEISLFLHLCTKNLDHDLQFLRYRAWQTEIGNFGSFFALLTPKINPKNQNFKKWKKLLEISSFYQKSIIWCMVPQIQSETEFFALLPP